MSGRLPGEMGSISRRVAWLALAYGWVMLLQRSAEATALGLFLQRVGAEHLPWIFLSVALLDIPLAMGYGVAARKVGHRRLLVAVAAALVASLAATTAWSGWHPWAGLFAGYVAASVGGAFLSIHWGVVLLDYFTATESRRAFPWIYAGGHAGGFVAGAVMTAVGKHATSSPWTSVAALVAALVGLTATMAVVGRLQEGARVRQGERQGTSELTLPRESMVPSVREGAGPQPRSLFMRSRLVRAIVASTLVMVILRLLLRTLYGAGLERAYGLSGSVVAVLGVYTMIASVVGLVLQVTVTPAALSRWGVGRINLAYGVAMLGALVGMGSVEGSPATGAQVTAAAAGRFTDLELKGAMKTPLSAMFYDAFSERDRAGARALVLGVVSPVSSVVGSLLLLGLMGVGVSMTVLAWAGAVVAVGYVGLCWIQARTYRSALEQQVLHWARVRKPGVSVEQALRLAEEQGDTRIAHLAQEARRES